MNPSKNLSKTTSHNKIDITTCHYLLYSCKITQIIRNCILVSIHPYHFYTSLLYGKGRWLPIGPIKSVLTGQYAFSIRMLDRLNKNVRE